MSSNVKAPYFKILTLQKNSQNVEDFMTHIGPHLIPHIVGSQRTASIAESQSQYIWRHLALIGANYFERPAHPHNCYYQGSAII